MGYIWNVFGERIGTSDKDKTDYSEAAKKAKPNSSSPYFAPSTPSAPSAPAAKSTGGSQNFGSLAGKIVPPSAAPSVGKSSGGSSAKTPSPSGASALIDALKGVGASWGAAGADNAALNSHANALRAAFMQSGGSISDIPTNLWGSDPGKGFQTGADLFSGGTKSGSTGSPLKEALTGAGNSVAGSGSPLTDALERASGHAQYFGGVEDYAKAIQKTVSEKGWEGLSDPEAAKLLFKGRPDLFGGPVKPGTQPYEEALQRSADLADKYGGPEKYAQFIMETVKKGGWKALSDPAAAEVLIQGRPDLFNAQPPAVQPPPIYQPGQPQDIMNLFNEIKNIGRQDLNYETAPMVMQQYNQIMDMINTTESSLLKRMEEMGKGVDPATQAALASLKDTINEQREYLKEEMSSRNLLQSGIYLGEMDKRINKNELSATQQLLGKRLSDIQNQINSALTSFANARINATSQYGTEAIKAAENTAQRRQEASKSLQSALLKAIEESGRQQTESNKLAWEKEKYYAPWVKGPTWEQQAQYTGFVPPSYPGDPSAAIRKAQDDWNAANVAGNEEGKQKAHALAEALRRSAGWGSGGEAGTDTERYMTRAGLPTWDREKATMPYRYPTAGQQLEQDRWSTEWPWEQKKIEHDINRPYSSPNALTPYQQYQINSGEKASASKEATNKAKAQILSYSSKAEALADMKQYADAMAAQGVDMEEVLKAVNERFPYDY